jgi:gliding motility-associated-like protein
MRFKLQFILLFFLLGFLFSAGGQSVSIKCTQVLPGGDVLLHWKPLVIGTGFYNYTIYTSDALPGPYTQLTVITDISQDNYFHTGAGASTAPVYYYLITNKDSGPSPPSDTIATMLLSSSTIDYETIDLSWTPLHYQPEFLPDMQPWYLLYREYPPGNWTVIDSTQNNNISHHFWLCNGNSDTVRFRIGVRDLDIGCISLSNQKGEVLNNLSNRYPPVIDSVSIDANGKVIIGWEAGLERDIKGYYIFKVTPTVPPTNDSIDYVDGRLSTSYTHIFSDPCSDALTYIILSVDSCGNESPFPFDTITFFDKPHTTIYLEEIQYDPCMMTNLLGWNEYENFDPEIDYTNIFCSIDGGEYALLETIYPGQVNYTHENLLPNTTYSYYVRAYSKDHQKSSTSCRKEVTTYNSPRPLFMYTRYASVEGNDQVDLLFYTDTNAHVQYYRILRSQVAEGPYAEAGLVPDTGSEYISFIDTEAEVTASSYYYQVEVVDSCGIASIIANRSRTIFLQAEALPDLSNLLTWNAYESWSGRVLGYRVYRRLDDSPPELLAELDSLTLSYQDNVSGLTGSVARITYFAEAFEGSSNPMGFREVSRSNEVLSEQEPRAYLPNGFLPLGTSGLFKPVVVFVGSEGYEFVIYNRWGQMIFQTTDPGEGWDGRFNGSYVPQDVYVYLLRFRNALGQQRQIKGNVAVIY